MTQDEKLSELIRTAYLLLTMAATMSGARQKDQLGNILNMFEPLTRSKDVVVEISPPNYLGRIDQLWAFLFVDDGGEGVCAGPFGALPVVPYIAADKARVESLRPLAAAMAKRFGKPVRLAKFTHREDLEIIRC